MVFGFLCLDMVVATVPLRRGHETENMRIASIQPSTIDGIKQLAKKIKRELNVTHTEALDLASRQGGYPSFVNARRTIGAGASGYERPSPRAAVFPVFLSAH